MALDLAFRGQNLPTLKTVVQSQVFENIIGPVGDLAGLRSPGKLSPDIDFVLYRPGTVVVTPAVLDGNGNIITPAVTDTWWWLLLRLSRTAEAGDFEDDPADTEPDRWNKSRIRKWMQNNGVFRTIRGIRVYEHTLGNGKRIQVWRGKEMAAQGVLFHEFLGGNSY